MICVSFCVSLWDHNWIKEVTRKPSLSCSSCQSSSPSRYEIQSSLGGAVDPVGEASARVGFSWVSILKSTPALAMIQWVNRPVQVTLLCLHLLFHSFLV